MVSKRNGCCCSLKSVFVSAAAVRLGHAHTPDNLAVLLSPDTAQNACHYSSCCIRSSFLCVMCLYVGHGTLFRMYNRAFNCLITMFFVIAVVHQYLSAKVPNRLFDAVAWTQQRNNSSRTSSLPRRDGHEPSFCFGVTLCCTKILYWCIVLYCTVMYCAARQCTVPLL